MPEREGAQTRRPRRRRGLGLVLACVLVSGCRGGGTTAVGAGGAGRDRSDVETAWFTEITTTSGLPVPDESWPDGEYFLPEIMGSGVALLDFDDDGRLDLLQVRHPPPGQRDAPAPNRLYRQTADGRFVDVSAKSGLADAGYGQGVAVADADDDGDLDVYFANYGMDAYFANRGDGTFEERTAAAGLARDADWSSAASFFDYDRDGDLDLFVVRYLRYEYRGQCLKGGGTYRDYCGPSAFDGRPDLLYRNEGSGVFVDVTAQAGLLPPDGGRSAKGLGTVCLDLDHDGWPDIFVANDGELNQLWINQRDGTFREEAAARGVAVNRHGAPEASMGVAVGDVDDDGYPDLYVTHLAQENNRLYCGGARGLFRDATIETGLARVDLPFTGFGCGLVDFDHDGDLDLAVANGRVYRGPVHAGARSGSFWNRYVEPNLLLRNDGGRFTDISAHSGGFGREVELSRGLAWGDLDRDGDLDLVISDSADGLRVYRNDAPPRDAHWLRVRARTGSRDAIGARLELDTGDRRRVTAILPHASYQSSSEPGAHFGLGTLDRMHALEVVWPDGSRERFAVAGVDREITVVQGSGKRP